MAGASGHVQAFYGPYQTMNWFQNRDDVTPGATGGGDSEDSSAGVIREPVNLTLALTAVYSVMFLLGIVGNIMAAFVVWQNKTMRTSTNFYVVSLCAADLAVLLVCLPPTIFEFYMDDVWYLGDIPCK